MVISSDQVASTTDAAQGSRDTRSDPSLDRAHSAEDSTANNDGDDSEQLDEAAVEILQSDRRANGEPLELDDVFDLLRNQRRRWVIKYLKDQDGSGTLDELAEWIAAKENDIEESMLSSSQRKRVYIGLYQCHLPKMDDLGVIEYDKNRGTVELQDVSQLEEYLPGEQSEAEPERSVPPEHAIGGGVGVFILAGLAELGPLAVISTTVWATLGAITLLGILVVRTLLTDRITF